MGAELSQQQQQAPVSPAYSASSSADSCGGGGDDKRPGVGGGSDHDGAVAALPPSFHRSLSAPPDNQQYKRKRNMSADGDHIHFADFSLFPDRFSEQAADTAASCHYYRSSSSGGRQSSRRDGFPGPPPPPPPARHYRTVTGITDFMRQISEDAAAAADPRESAPMSPSSSLSASPPQPLWSPADPADGARADDGWARLAEPKNTLRPRLSSVGDQVVQEELKTGSDTQKSSLLSAAGGEEWAAKRGGSRPRAMTEPSRGLGFFDYSMFPDKGWNGEATSRQSRRHCDGGTCRLTSKKSSSSTRKIT